jgi:DNA polymerase V
MRANMNVVGSRLWNELRGVPSIAWEYEPKAKKNICTSRAFGKLSNDYSVVKEAVSNHAAACAAKLRSQNSVCNEVNVFIATNPLRTEQKQYMHSITLQCQTPTNLTKEIIGYALKGLEIIFKPKDYYYLKCGVMVLNVNPQSAIQMSLFDTMDRTKDKILGKVMDTMNHHMGTGTVRMAVQRFDKRYRLRAVHLSKKYTTDIHQILKVKI